MQHAQLQTHSTEWSPTNSASVGDAHSSFLDQPIGFKSTESARIGLAEIWEGDCLHKLADLPNGSVDLVLTSPPYNIGKEYETKTNLDEYVAFQTLVLKECDRILRPTGSICWQIGNYVHKGEVIPLDSIVIPILRELGMKIRNRVIWTFGHGVHCSNRLSGRHETIVWATKSDDYVFNLDSIRVPQKYPGKKAYKGSRKGQLSGNPLGKNPGDVWEIGNVKHNHPEKTSHPCQFPEDLVRRCVLSLTSPGHLVVDPFGGSGTVAVVANNTSRRSISIEKEPKYVAIARNRVSRQFT